MPPRKKKQPRARKPRTVENEEYTALEMYCIWLNEYYNSLLKAGFKSDLALSFVMDKTSYPNWVEYKAPTEDEIKKYKMSIFARSPFIVTIAESGQEGSKVELRIWNGTGSAPTDPQYTLSKLIPASNNVNTYYNISPYIREYLNFDERQTNWNNNTTTPTAQWCNVQVKRYKLDGTTYTLLDTTTYKAFDGFGYYEQGYNPTLSYDILHDEGTFFYAYDANEDPSTNTDYRSNFITVATTSTAVRARWTNLNSGATQEQAISNSSVIDVRKVHQSYYADGNKLEIFYVLSGVVL